MKLIKRCYGCDKVMWPWQDTVRTRLVGKIHRVCAFNAHIRYQIRKEFLAFNQHFEEKALKELCKDEAK